MVVTKASNNEDFKSYYLSEVALRNGKDMNEVWIVVKDVVYDVTAYCESDEHPGGSELILEYAGKECTKVFNDAGHSADAIKEMRAMKIGELVEVSLLEFQALVSLNEILGNFDFKFSRILISLSAQSTSKTFSFIPRNQADRKANRGKIITNGVTEKKKKKLGGFLFCWTRVNFVRLTFSECFIELYL